MKAIVQHFIGTTAQWLAANPVLYKAVWGFEIAPGGKRYAKLGDGVRPWNDLPYFDAENIKGLPEIIAALNQRIDGINGAWLAETESEARNREAADRELSEKIGGVGAGLSEKIEAEAREREAAGRELSEKIDLAVSRLEGRIAGLEGAFNLLRSDFAVYKAALDYLIEFVESKHGPLGGSFPLVLESGEYLVTESDDYLVTA